MAEGAESAAREVVALWAALLAQKRQREARQEGLRRAALEPMWRRELTRLRETGQQPELPVLTEEMVLPTEWDTMFTRVQLSAFLAFLHAPTSAREPKANLVQRVGERLETDTTLPLEGTRTVVGPASSAVVLRAGSAQCSSQALAYLQA